MKRSKTLSENLSKEEKCQVVAGFLFPSNEQTTRAIEPRMCALHTQRRARYPGSAPFAAFSCPRLRI